MSESHRSKQFLSDAYGLQSKDDSLGFYGKWAGDYDQTMEKDLNYIAPKGIADRLAPFITSPEAQVLDIGCGTGLTAKYLAEHGFTTIDGLDLSTKMLEQARQRGLYRDLLQTDLTLPLALEDECYDAAISSGTFTLGHVGCEPFDEIFRILKPDGVFGCTIHADIWEPLGFKRKVSELEAAGSITTMASDLGEYFGGSGDQKAMYQIFQKRA